MKVQQSRIKEKFHRLAVRFARCGHRKFQLGRIKQKIHKLQTEGWSRYQEQCSQVRYHRFELAPSLSEEAVHTFEAQHGIRLPSAYRAFLREVGGSGAGPYCGILPLEKWQETLWFGHYGGQSALTAPCVLTEALVEKNWYEEVGGPDWEARAEADEWQPYQGALAICDQGCTYYAVLILNGPLRGRVCNIDMTLLPPRFSPHASFLDWYEGWLDELLAGKKLWWYGH